jgi:TPR repeat protein
MKNNQQKKNSIGVLGLVLIFIVITFFLIRHLTQSSKYNKNIEIANGYYSVAKYDSAMTYYIVAKEIKLTDTLESKITALQHLKAGLKNYYNSNFEQAFNDFEQASDFGSGHADYYLGEMYFNGFALAIDYDKGIQHTQKALDSGFDMALWRLAVCYEYGFAVKKDKEKSDNYYSKALKPLMKLAESNDPEALINLGSMYKNGNSVTKDAAKAIKYFQSSLDHGNNIAIGALANRYFYGEGVKEDYDKGIQLLKSGVESGDLNSIYYLGRIYVNTDSDINKIKEGLELLKRAAERKNSNAIHELGKIYSRIYYLPVNPNYTLAIKYFEETMTLDKYNAEVINDMGFMYQCGFGVKKDYKKAIEYYLISNEVDSINSNNNLFYIAYLKYHGGNGIQRDRTEAANYLKRAANLGNEDAKEYLNNMNELNYILYGCAVDTFLTYIE